MDAVDHRPFAEGRYDLTSATFEYVGAADVDNPAVPNVNDIGPRAWTNAVGQGLYISGVNEFLLIADVPDASQMLHDNLSTPSGIEHHLIPKDAILDAVGFIMTPELQANSSAVFCDPWTNPEVDHAPARLNDSALLSAIHRRILGNTTGGRIVLQRTKTSAADFYRTAPTPGQIP